MALVLLRFLIVASVCVTISYGLAVMSVDLGSEFMKVAIVKPGVPMEIAINSESRRKTPLVVAMRSDERTFGDSALSTAVKYPDKAYWYLQDLIGKTSDNPIVKLYKQRFPYYNMKTDPDTQMPYFEHADGSVYYPEELLAMVLQQAQETASTFAEQPINEAVITVPVFFNQAERRALLRAAEMVDIKVLQLMNTESAVALNYGVFRRKNFNATESHYMFFDMGASSTSATVVGYQLAKSKNSATGATETNPQMTVKGIGYDRTLGGVEFNLRLRDYLGKAFNKQKKTDTDVFTNNRAMGKLYKEAARLKHVLSANAEHMSQIEGLLDDQDFKLKVTREEFEGLCEDLFDRIAKPIEEAMKMSEVTWDEISEVILMGGGTRVPKVKQTLQKVINREELGQGINTDEAAALGAVYQAAYLSKGFRVKKFVIKEATLYPIQVTFEKVKSSDDDSEGTRVVKRMLYSRGNPYPQKKVMAFNKHVKDFSFDINYAELDFLGEDRLSAFGETKLQHVSMSGVEAAYDKYSSDAEPKGIKAHFRLDESGLLHLDRSEAVYEREPQVETGDDGEESTLKKLGSYFFGSEEKDPATEGGVDGQNEEPKPEEKADDEKKEEKKEEKVSDEEKQEDTKEESKEEKKEEPEKESTDEESKDGKKQEESTGDSEEKKQEEEAAEKPGEEKSADEKPAEETSEPNTGDKEQTDGEKTESEKTGEGEKTDAKQEALAAEEKKKKKVIKEPVKVETIQVDRVDPTEDKLKESKKKIEDMRQRDIEKRMLEAAKNDLETYIFDLKDKLYQDVFEKCSTEEERETLMTELNEASDWLYDQEYDTARQVFVDKLDSLKGSAQELFYRVEQYKERPRALEAFNSIMNHTSFFLVSMKNFTGEDQPFTEVEFAKLEDMVSEAKIWNNSFVAELLEQPLTEKPKTTIEDIARKFTDLDREVKYLIGKAKRFTPKPKPVEVPPINETDGGPETIIIDGKEGGSFTFGQGADEEGGEEEGETGGEEGDGEGEEGEQQEETLELGDGSEQPTESETLELDEEDKDTPEKVEL